MPLRRHLIAVITCFLVLLGSAALFAEEAPQKLAPEMATRIAKLALATTPLRGSDIELLIDNWNPDFYQFNITQDHGDLTSNVGDIAVNSWTGDAWDNHFCHGQSRTRIDSAELRSLRHDIRKNLHLSTAECRRLASRRPSCLFP